MTEMMHEDIQRYSFRDEKVYKAIKTRDPPRSHHDEYYQQIMDCKKQMDEAAKKII